MATDANGTSVTVGPRRTTAELQRAIQRFRGSPSDDGRVEMIVARPDVNVREVLQEGPFTVQDGLTRDGWRERGSRSTADGSADPRKQVAAINRRFLEFIAGAHDRWSLAGDQLVLDMDLSIDNLRPGDRLRAGTAEFEVTDAPHTGCAKFRDRYGVDALRFANSREGKHLRLRGMYLRVAVDGIVRQGDVIHKL